MFGTVISIGAIEQEVTESVNYPMGAGAALDGVDDALNNIGRGRRAKAVGLLTPLLQKLVDGLKSFVERFEQLASQRWSDRDGNILLSQCSIHVN